MKKAGIITGTILTVFTAVILLIAGAIHMNKQNEKEQLIEIVNSEEATSEYEIVLHNLDKKALKSGGKIKTYKVDTSRIKKNPMGGIFVTLIINNNSELRVTISLDKSGTPERLQAESVTYPLELEQLIGED